jgi:uncharacterized membrane protein
LSPQNKTGGREKAIFQRIFQLDLIGCVLFVSSIVTFFIALQWGGGEYDCNSATIIGLFVGFVVSMLLVSGGITGKQLNDQSEPC